MLRSFATVSVAIGLFACGPSAIKASVQRPSAPVAKAANTPNPPLGSAAAMSDAERRKRVLERTQKSPPSLTLQTIEAGIRFYIEPPGPCTCPPLTIVICVRDIESSFQRSKKWHTPTGNAPTCPPNAGCAPAVNAAIIECSVDDDLTLIPMYRGGLLTSVSASSGVPMKK